MAAELGAVPLAESHSRLTAAALEQRFAGRPHVGVVMHFEGWDAQRTGDHALATLAGHAPDCTIETTVAASPGAPAWHAVASVSRGAGLELWLVAGERPPIGSTLEIRAYHAIDDAALADEYLTIIAGRLQQPGRPHG